MWSFLDLSLPTYWGDSDVILRNFPSIAFAHNFGMRWAVFHSSGNQRTQGVTVMVNHDVFYYVCIVEGRLTIFLVVYFVANCSNWLINRRFNWYNHTPGNSATYKPPTEALHCLYSEVPDVHTMRVPCAFHLLMIQLFIPTQPMWTRMMCQ